MFAPLVSLPQRIRGRTHADKGVGERQQVLQDVEQRAQAEDEGLQLVLMPGGPDDPRVGRRAWGLERQAQVIAQVRWMGYYPTGLLPVVHQEVGLSLERLQVDLDEAGRLSSQHHEVNEDCKDSAML